MKKQELKKQELRTWLKSDNVADTIAKVMPSNFRMETLIHLAGVRVYGDEKLAEAFKTTAGKLSLLRSLTTLARYGLVPDGTHAHLIPFKGVISAMIDYKGYVQLLYKEGCKLIDGAVVYQDPETGTGDEFWVDRADGKIVHKLAFPRIGRPIAVWTKVILPDGTEHIHPMTIEDVESKRRRSNSFNNGPNQTDPDDMRLRTCLKNHIKWLPQRESLTSLVADDNDAPLETETKKEKAEVVADGKGLHMNANVKTIETTKMSKNMETIVAQLRVQGVTLPELEWWLQDNGILLEDQQLKDLSDPSLEGSMDKILEGIAQLSDIDLEAMETAKPRTSDTHDAAESSTSDTVTPKKGKAPKPDPFNFRISENPKFIRRNFVEVYQGNDTWDPWKDVNGRTRTYSTRDAADRAYRGALVALPATPKKKVAGKGGKQKASTLKPGEPGKKKGYNRNSATAQADAEFKLKG